MNEKAGWGGKRAGAGRKKSASVKETVVVRIDRQLLPTVTELRARFKAGLKGDNLFPVTNNQDRTAHPVLQEKRVLNDRIDRLNQNIESLSEQNALLQRNLDRQMDLTRLRVQERDVANMKLVAAESRVADLSAQLKKMKQHYVQQEHRCMAQTSAGVRCSKKAVTDVFHEGLLFHVCLQHGRVLEQRKNASGQTK